MCDKCVCVRLLLFSSNFITPTLQVYAEWALPMAKQLQEKVDEYMSGEMDEQHGVYSDDCDDLQSDLNTVQTMSSDGAASAVSTHSQGHKWVVHMEDDLPFLAFSPKKKTNVSSALYTGKHRYRNAPLPDEFKNLVYRLWEQTEADKKKKPQKSKTNPRLKKEIRDLETEIGRLNQKISSGNADAVIDGDKLTDMIRNLNDLQGEQRKRLDELASEQSNLSNRHLALTAEADGSSRKKFHLISERDALHRNFLKQKMRTDEQKQQLEELMKLVDAAETKLQVLQRQVRFAETQMKELKQSNDYTDEQFRKKIEQQRALLEDRKKNKEAAIEKLKRCEADLAGLQDAKRHHSNRMLSEQEQARRCVAQLERMKQVHFVVMDENREKTKRREARLQRLRRDLVFREKFQMTPTEKLHYMVNKFMVFHYRDLYTDYKYEVGIKEAKAETSIQKLRAHLEVETSINARWENQTQNDLESQLNSRKELFDATNARWLSEKAEIEQLEIDSEQKQAALRRTEQQIASLKSKVGNKRANKAENNMIFAEFMISSFRGDYLSLNHNAPALQQVYSQGDTEIVFSGLVDKVNRHSKHDKRALVITNQSVCIMLPHTPWTIKRRIHISKIHYISLAQAHGSLFVLHHKDAYDSAFLAPKRSEIVYRLMELHKHLTGVELKYVIDSKLYVSDKGLTSRQISVVGSEKLETERNQLPHSVNDVEEKKVVRKVLMMPRNTRF
jgi:hypothetical protein